MNPIDHWKRLSLTGRLALGLMLCFHLSLVASTSNRGLYDRSAFGRLFSAWRPLAFDTSGHFGRGGDFYAIYEAGHQALLGRPVYQVQPEMNDLPREVSRMRAPAVATYRYLPLTAYTLGAALNALPPERFDESGAPVRGLRFLPSAYIAWVLFNELMLLAGVLICARLAVTTGQALGATAVWLMFYPLHIEYYVGQFSFLMGFCLFLCAVGLISENGRLARTAWGVSLFVKTYSFLFALYWLWRGPRRAAIVWLGIAATTTALYFAVFPSDWQMLWQRGIQGRLFPAEIEDASASTAVQPGLYPGSMGVQRGVMALCRLVDPDRRPDGSVAPPDWSRFLMWLCILGPAPALGWAATRREAPPLAVLGLFWVYWFFAYLDTWEHHLTMLCPLLALCVATRLLGRIESIAWTFLLACPSLWYPLGRLWQTGATDTTAFFALETAYYLIKPIGIVGLFVSLLLRISPRDTRTRERISKCPSQ